MRRYREAAERLPPPVVHGRLTRAVGLALEAVGCQAAVGGRCVITAMDGSEVEAEVVGFSGERLYLMLAGEDRGLTVNARVTPARHGGEVPVGAALLGRVLDGAGRPWDGRGAIRVDDHVPLQGRPINPMSRAPIHEPLDVGVRAINAVLTVGRGQRMGLFAGSGVGKSSLLGMMTRYTDADVTVVGLIGERGREVREFVQNTLGDEGRRRAVVVAVPADHPPLMRLRGAMLATSIAEYFRDQGQRVLLLMDSLTRYAQAQREIALAIGEPPATKGYPPSVFAKLPHLVERAGAGEGIGSITAFYTVLVEGDDQLDPIADAARAILDGHVVLSRALADTGHFPAIDIEGSVSRLMQEITGSAQQEAARALKGLVSLYNRNQDLITLGAYRKGHNPQVDEAVERHPQIARFLRQGIHERVDLGASVGQLIELMKPSEAEGNSREIKPHLG
ncbi:flagellar protein export ATPase FliI [Thioalkalicoccus limnaeus]|uniref:Flagellum-specific ATP synthase n=1 Tax=Thioalkalicoccus limnaeus TaxID=120681 RepID=A0ABV4BCM1_9GAMM